VESEVPNRMGINGWTMPCPMTDTVARRTTVCRSPKF
jgi:hypothetical protein